MGIPELHLWTIPEIPCKNSFRNPRQRFSPKLIQDFTRNSFWLWGLLHNFNLKFLREFIGGINPKIRYRNLFRKSCGIPKRNPWWIFKIPSRNFWKHDGIISSSWKFWITILQYFLLKNLQEFSVSCWSSSWIFSGSSFSGSISKKKILSFRKFLLGFLPEKELTEDIHQ